MTTIKQFLRAEHGAVTVDWVVLTSAIVGLGLATTAVVSGGVENISDDTAQELADVEPGDGFATFGQNGGGGGAMALLHWGSQEELDTAVTNALANFYGNDLQRMYDTAMANINNGLHVANEIDVIGNLMARAEAEGFVIETGANASYEDMHAAYTANGTL